MVRCPHTLVCLNLSCNISCSCKQSICWVGPSWGHANFLAIAFIHKHTSPEILEMMISLVQGRNGEFFEWRSLGFWGDKAICLLEEQTSHLWLYSMKSKWSGSWSIMVGCREAVKSIFELCLYCQNCVFCFENETIIKPE